MKKLLVVAFFGLIVAGCNKTNTVVPVPDAGTIVAGVYPLTYVRGDSASLILYEYNLPYTAGTTTLAGSLTARRDSSTAVFLTETIQITGQSDQTSVIGEIHLQTSTTGTGYDMYLNNQKIGTTDGSTINVDKTQSDPTTKIVYQTVIAGKKVK